MHRAPGRAFEAHPLHAIPGLLRPMRYSVQKRSRGKIEQLARTFAATQLQHGHGRNRKNR